jgi:predicted MPP superfamily phosphohydrolase
LKDLMKAHELMGYDLLMDEHRFIEESGEKLAIIGVQNIGVGRFPWYGNLGKAHAGTEEASTKLLLSHDPTHWNAEVTKKFKDIDVAFAGHTHGTQFGVKIGNYKWSPAQYVYKQWAGLYQEGEQQIYVNRGYGYLGYPGRVGMPPEITVFTLS